MLGSRGLSIAALLLLASLFACERERPADPIAARLDAYLSECTRLGRFSGAVLVERDTTTLLRKGYGYADVAARRPFTPETQLPVASISKMFTAIAVLKLRDAGKLALEDSICRHVD